MAEFTFEALTADGTFHKGTLSASDKQSANILIEARSLTVVRLEEVENSTSGFQFNSLFTRTISKNDITILFNDLASLAQSRLRIDEAIELLLQELELGSTRQLLGDLLQRLKNGENLSDAMEAHLDVFDRLEIEMLRLAETSGNLGETLQQIAEDRELRAKVQNQIFSSLRYPAFLMIGSIVIMIFFLAYVIPQFESILTAEQTQGSTLGIVFSISRVLNENSQTMMILALVALVAGWIAAKQATIRTFLYKLLLRMPVAGTVATTYRNARICLLIAQTQRAGVELPIALSVIGPAVDGTGETNISKNAVSGLRQGRKLADVLAEFGNLHDLALRMIRIGEESSQVEALAARAGTLYESRAERQLTRVIAIIGPATLIFISTVIGGLIVLIMSALLSINELVTL